MRQDIVPYKELPTLSDRIRRMENGISILVSRDVIDFVKFGQLKMMKENLQRRKEREAEKCK